MDVKKKAHLFKAWMRENWQWAIPAFSLVCGAVWNILLYPLCTMLWAFILTTSTTNADMIDIKPKVTSLEKVTYEIRGQLGTLIKQNDLILNGKYRDIKEYVEHREQLNKP